jgi:hypothetical protein
MVTLQCNPGTAPTPVGGTIADGTYTLQSEVFYGPNCPAAEEDRNIWLICGSSWQTVQEFTPVGMATQTHWYNFTVTQTGGPNLNLAGVCGFTSTAPLMYDATPSTLTLYVGGGTTPGTGRVDTYVRQ